MSASLWFAILAALAVATAAPAADITAVRALEEQCEQARAAKLKPLRDAEIARCKADRHADPTYCERFWRDYGNALRRPNGTMQPRLFDDLPECVAARAARRDLSYR